MGTRPEQSVLDLIGRIYDAALEPSLWPDVTLALRNHFNAESGSLYVVDMRSDGVGFRANANLDPDGFHEYEDYYAAVDIWNRRFAAMPAGRPYLTQQLFPDDYFIRTEFWNDFLRRYRIFHGMGGFVINEGGLAVVSGVHRPMGDAPFDESDLEQQTILFSHLARALQLSNGFELLKAQRDASVAALDRLSMGAILLDVAGRVLAMNLAARKIVAQNDGLKDLDGGLMAATASETDALRRLIAQASATGAGHGLHAGGELAVSRPSFRGPLSVLVAPFGRKATAPGLDLVHERAAAVVFVGDPEARQETPADVLMRLYGLTPAEARLAEAMAGGGPLTEAAERLGIGRETARSQLKQVFAKTGTRRQAELVRVLLSGLAVVSAGDPSPDTQAAGDASG